MWKSKSSKRIGCEDRSVGSNIDKHLGRLPRRTIRCKHVRFDGRANNAIIASLPPTEN